jgi:hypothetical protein
MKWPTCPYCQQDCTGKYGSNVYGCTRCQKLIYIGPVPRLPVTTDFTHWEFTR